jgi:hypothetical protein
MTAQSTAVSAAGCSDMPASVYCEIYFLRLNQKIIAPKGMEADMVQGAAGPAFTADAPNSLMVKI